MKKIVFLVALFLLVSQGFARIQEINPELIIAAAQGDEGKVVELLDGGVDVDVQNDQGKTALIVASELGNTAIVRTLLKYNANPSIEIKGVLTACTEEESPDFPTVCATILPGGTPPFIQKEKWTALHFAADNGKKEIALLLLKKGDAVVDSKDARRRTPLIIAAKKGNLSLVKLLLRHGAQVNEKNGSNRTALYYAVAYADKTGDEGIEVIRELKNNNAEINDEILEVAGKRRDSEKINAILTGSRHNRPITQVLSSD